MHTRSNHFSDEAIVLRKTIQKDSNLSITLLTKQHGKCIVTAFGTRRILSKRLSHLETGNVIKCSWRENGEFKTLQETDLLYAHSGIKESSTKLDVLYTLLFIIFKIAPENEPAVGMYNSLLSTLRDLQKKEFTRNDLNAHVTAILIHEGYISKEESQQAAFEPIEYVENLMGRKLDKIM